MLMNIFASSPSRNSSQYPFHLRSNCTTIAPMRLVPSRKAWLDAKPKPMREILSRTLGNKSTPPKDWSRADLKNGDSSLKSPPSCGGDFSCRGQRFTVCGIGQRSEKSYGRLDKGIIIKYTIKLWSKWMKLREYKVFYCKRDVFVSLLMGSTRS